MYFQKTVRSDIKCSGIGLHTGRKINMKVRPAGVDEGVVFHRNDLSENNTVKAELNNVCDTTLATTLGMNGTRVSTVEHLLSAFSGMGINNAIIEIDSFEIPIMDGSALPFVDMLKAVGTEVQNKPKRLMVIEKPVAVGDGEGKAMFLPSSQFEITYDIDFDHPVVEKQSYHVIFSTEIYEKDICPARTFGFLRDVEYLQAKGLALGGSLKNAVVLDDERVINKEGLRFPDEFVKHKILDAIGDLFLLGMPIIGHFVAYKSGHKLNNLLLKELLANQECWRIIHYYNGEEREETIDFSFPINVASVR
ncbi:MAG: UDP-3-O-acyl-N-acetylglucosamine deacetylase [Deltaproteobacteria bacterium]|nr:UDP-3-O-acyl-N-acetylglucosamine deacetylase [Deltaproteobacteria bacterium]